MKWLGLSEINIKIVSVGLITITLQAKNVKDDNVYFNLPV